MLRPFHLLSFIIISLISYSCRDKPLDQLSIAELDKHIAQAQIILDSLHSVRNLKVAADTSGLYASPSETVISHLLAVDSSVTIKGKILDSLISKTIRINKDRPYQKDFNIKMDIEEDGSFKVDLDVEAGFYNLDYANESHSIYLAPGQNMVIIFDSTEHKLMFGGDLAEENMLYQNIDIALGDYIDHALKHDFKSNPKLLATHIAKRDSFYSVKSNLLSATRHELDLSFIDLLDKKCLYAQARCNLKHGDLINDLSQEGLTESRIDMNDESLFSLYEYRKFIFESFEIIGESLLKDNDNNNILYHTAKYKLVDSLFTSKKISDFLKTDVVYEAIANIHSSAVNPLIYLYQNEVDDHSFRESINRRYNSIIHPLPGTLAPEITGVTFEGDDFRLSDYRGKYVYIFSWATWCGPCKVELPFYERMLEDYAEENIVFIGVSVDKDKKKWTESFFYNHYPGIQVLVPGDWKSPFVRDYDVKSIPQFILIDPQGVIIDTDAQRPTKAIKAQLSNYGIFPKLT